MTPGHLSQEQRSFDSVLWQTSTAYSEMIGMSQELDRFMGIRKTQTVRWDELWGLSTIAFTFSLRALYFCISVLCWNNTSELINMNQNQSKSNFKKKWFFCFCVSIVLSADITLYNGKSSGFPMGIVLYRHLLDCFLEWHCQTTWSWVASRKMSQQFCERIKLLLNQLFGIQSFKKNDKNIGCKVSEWYQYQDLTSGMSCDDTRCQRRDVFRQKKHLELRKMPVFFLVPWICLMWLEKYISQMLVKKWWFTMVQCVKQLP